MHEEPIPLIVNKTQDIFGMIYKAFLWEKHMQKQKYCCRDQNSGLFAGIDILAEETNTEHQWIIRNTLNYTVEGSLDNPHPREPGSFHPLCNRHGWINPVYKA